MHVLSDFFKCCECVCMDYSECHGHTGQMEKDESSGLNNLGAEGLSSVSNNNSETVHRKETV